MQIYDLQNETLENRYNSCALNYYRIRLKSLQEGTDFNENRPTSQEGRLPAGRPAAPEEAKNNGGQIDFAGFLFKRANTVWETAQKVGKDTGTILQTQIQNAQVSL